MNRRGLAYRQSTGAVILDKIGQVLIVQKIGYKDNEWNVPGGGIEENNALHVDLMTCNSIVLTPENIKDNFSLFPINDIFVTQLKY